MIAAEIQSNLNRELVTSVYWSFKLAQQHRLKAARELKLQQAFVKEKCRVMSAFRALGDGQQNQSICCAASRLEFNVYRQNIVKWFDVEVFVVVGVNHVAQVRVAGKRCVFDSNQ